MIYDFIVAKAKGIDFFGYSLIHRTVKLRWISFFLGYKIHTIIGYERLFYTVRCNKPQ